MENSNNADEIISSGYRFVPSEKDIEKMRYYFARKTDPKCLAEGTSRSKIIARLFIASAMGWSDAVYALKFKALEYGFGTPIISSAIAQGKSELKAKTYLGESSREFDLSEASPETCLETAIRDLPEESLRKAISVLASEFDEESFEDFIFKLAKNFLKPEEMSSLLDDVLEISEETKHDVLKIISDETY